MTAAGIELGMMLSANGGDICVVWLRGAGDVRAVWPTHAGARINVVKIVAAMSSNLDVILSSSRRPADVLLR